MGVVELMENLLSWVHDSTMVVFVTCQDKCLCLCIFPSVHMTRILSPVGAVLDTKLQEMMNMICSMFSGAAWWETSAKNI